MEIYFSLSNQRDEQSPSRSHPKPFSIKPSEEKKKKEPTSLEGAFLEKPLLMMQGASPCEKNAGSQELKLFFDVMVDTISHQEKKGISTTTLLLGENPKLTILNGTEITLKCYDTDPSKFHIDFLSTPQGGAFLAQHLPTLQSHLQQAFPQTFFSLAKPLLNTYVTKDKKNLRHSIVTKTSSSNSLA